MLKALRLYIASLFFSDLLDAIIRERKDIELEVNKRVAKFISQMDPFEPLLKHYNGIFSEEFERPEEKMDARSHLGFIMWAYTQRNDPNFTYLLDWIANSAGNETIKRASITPERIQYGRAQISNIVLIKREVSRLANLYEEKLAQGREEGFDSELIAE